MFTPKFNGGPADLVPATGIPRQSFEALRDFDTCTIANAIERCGVRLRNEGFTKPGLQWFTPFCNRLLGFAATCRVRSSDPPMTGDSYFEGTDWWAAIETLPSPRVVVIEDLEPEAVGASVGAVHAAILKAFHCDGVITNGAVRDLTQVDRMHFAMFARYAAVSHSYVHLVDYGTEVKIFGLPVKSGDLVLADCHGAIVIPLEIIEDLPRVASEIRAHEQRIIDICESPEFSPEKLMDTIRSKR
jgi:regulator of RNase E activity RraA